MLRFVLGRGGGTHVAIDRMTQERTRPKESTTEGAYHILADSSLTDERFRVLKAGDTFALFDQYGDITPSKNGEQGLYHEGTRFLSCLTLESMATGRFS